MLSSTFQWVFRGNAMIFFCEVNDTRHPFVKRSFKKTPGMVAGVSLKMN
jgi:hypothetical protein